MMRSWSEVQALAERAALGAGVPFAQAARFGAGVARHLADSRPHELVSQAFADADHIVALSLEVDRAIEAASTSANRYDIRAAPELLVASLMQALPCDVRLHPSEQGLAVTVMLDAAPSGQKPLRIDAPERLWSEMEALAALTYVPESAASRARGAGAGLMELD